MLRQPDPTLLQKVGSSAMIAPRCVTNGSWKEGKKKMVPLLPNLRSNFTYTSNSLRQQALLRATEKKKNMTDQKTALILYF